VLVAAGGIGIAVAQIAATKQVADRLDRAALRIGGGTLFVTMPLAVLYASGSAFGIPSLGLPAMAAIHGTLNVVGFAIPSMIGWSRVDR